MPGALQAGTPPPSRDPPSRNPAEPGPPLCWRRAVERQPGSTLAAAGQAFRSSTRRSPIRCTRGEQTVTHRHFQNKGRSSAWEVAWLFLRLGLVAFGGPAAHTAMMRHELVHRRGWVSDERFVDLIGATNLIPGPNSTELAIHLGFDRARWRGLVAAGVCFILPAALIVTGLAWAYVHYGNTPAVAGLLYGIVPVVIAIIVHALVGLARVVIRGVWFAGLALAALVAYAVGVNELLVLFSGALLALLARAIRHPPRASPTLAVAPLMLGQPLWPNPSG
ncbi:MAG: chromate transporter, partial [Micromonosporaceae bacterium]|nr:chromate transporter [Micromonosporaceae bacterium]